jgi:hypothetical protein
MKARLVGKTLAWAAIAVGVAAFGCEAIVTNNVAPYQPSTGGGCSMTPYIDAGVGSCAAGTFCEGAGCVACLPKGDDPCNGFDDDCDGIIDDGPKSDHDQDGFTNCGNPADLAHTLDCNDDDKTISPAGHEVCNGKDDNCDGIIDNPDLVCPMGETCVPSTGQCISNAAVCVPCSQSNVTGCCASPNVCDRSTQQCVAPSSQDAGGGCTSNLQCSTGLCATATELPGQPPVCTVPCCTTADCAPLGSGFVCYSAGTGGNYCAASSSISGTPPATCCNDGNCTGGQKCTAVGSGSTAGFQCATPPGGATTNHSCNSNSSCESGYCQSYTDGLGDTVNICIPPCCSSYSCGTYQTVNQFLCYDDYIPPATSGPVVPVCDYIQPSGNPSASQSHVGDTCTKNTDCFTNRCLTFPSGTFCSDVCCVDSDCNKPGWVCLPTPDGPVTGLRCQPKPTT